MAKRKSSRAAPTELYQFKITLQGIRPPAWRRIQVADCTLDELHEHIQNAMGWTNSHLHEFEIAGKRHGDPEILGDSIEPFSGIDSRKETIGELLKERRKGFRFRYLYDFGDSWDHDIVYEGKQAAEPGLKYPACTEGARACPPEDCGGSWGYESLLQVLATPTHKDHEEMREWAGEFEPEVFAPEQATKSMRKGLPRWRAMR